MITASKKVLLFTRRQLLGAQKGALITLRADDAVRYEAQPMARGFGRRKGRDFLALSVFMNMILAYCF